ncbi:MBL fold metallo-hydrolase [Nitratireductor aestuarii]|uniref:MBL fold metallo-hydrolase n=1 Tax=Nitratireductor aestuarii TaxID=1735103 RepID=UPI00166B1B30|nr:MBL fold metallo-hydrolase [Nitratireductor aestuarii]
MIELAPGVLWARLVLPFQLNHVNVYVLDDGDSWVVVDTGVYNQATCDQWEALLSGPLAGRPVSRVIVTHFHPDHIGMAGWLCRRMDASLTMTPCEYKTAERMLQATEGELHGKFRALYGSHGLTSPCLEKVVAVGHEYHSIVSDLPGVVELMSRGDLISIGGRSFRVFTGGGHSPEHGMLYCEADRLLLCADQVLGRISPNIGVLPSEPDADPLGVFLRSLRDLRAEIPDDTLLLPGHDVPFAGLHKRVDELTRHHHDRCAAILTACKQQALSALELVPHVFERKLDLTQIGFALAETVAHINRLVAEGKLTQLERDGLYSYAAEA